MNDDTNIRNEVMWALTDTILHLILLPTEKCNFRCVYCYEDFLVGKMKPETVDAVGRLLDRRAADLNRLAIEWFGGEPLLAQDVIYEITTRAKTLTTLHPNLKYSGSMTTNGYLLNLETAEALHELGVRSYQISLDGPKEWHDRTRVQINGKGSFDVLWGNLLALRQSSLDIDVLLRVHLTPQNISAMDDFVATLGDIFLNDKRFRVVLKPVERLGGPNDGNIETLSHSEAAKVQKRLERILFGDDRTAPAPLTEICYAAKPNSYVIRANGIVCKCTVALDDPRNHVGHVQPDGTLALQNEAIRPWLLGLETQNSDTLGCPLGSLPAISTPTSKRKLNVVTGSR